MTRLVIENIDDDMQTFQQEKELKNLSVAISDICNVTKELLSDYLTLRTAMVIFDTVTE